MAKLRSEDSEYKSFLEIRAGGSVNVDVANTSEQWQFYSLSIGHGGRHLLFTSPSEEKQAYQGFIKNVENVADGYLFCRTPKDEVLQLAQALDNFAEGGATTFGFEPVEPCFDLKLDRPTADEIRLTIFVDEGNVLTDVARWDALGLRFFTTKGNLLAFTEELRRDFAC
ncbi:MAG: hypothetical protein K2X93_08370 [Candidatus Obscuribacterales bacterium]|nr:hypothetical protein [Candidatus Obscuribacterales bacterium]